MLHDDFFDHYHFAAEDRQRFEVFYIRNLIANSKDEAFERTAKEFYLAGLLTPPYRECLIVAELSSNLSSLLLLRNNVFVESLYSKDVGFTRHPDRTLTIVDGYLEWTTDCAEAMATIVIASLMTLCMKSMIRDRVDISSALNLKRTKRGRSHLLPYTIISNPRPSHGDGTGTHASPIPHWRRGHVRRYKSGRAIVIEPTLVNAAVGEPVKRRAYITR